MVYQGRSSDRGLDALTKALTPGQNPLLENTTSLQEDKSLSRCALKRLNLSSFKVRSLPGWVTPFSVLQYNLFILLQSILDAPYSFRSPLRHP